MNIGIETLTSNVGVGFEFIVIMLICVGGIIFYAKDVRLGLILHFFMFGLTFAWFYYAKYNYTIPLIMMFVFLVLMSLNLYATNKAAQRGSII